MQKFCSFVFICLLFLSIPIACASDNNLDISAELMDNQVDSLNLDKQILVEQNLVVHFTVKNTNGLWLNLNNLKLHMDATKDGDRFTPISTFDDTLLIQELLIPPNREVDYYVVLEEYNSLSKNDRIGTWSISFDTEPSSCYSFTSLELKKETYLPLTISKPNNIEFTVHKEEVQLDKNGGLLPDISYDDIAATDNITSIIVSLFIIGGIAVGAFKKIKH